MNTNTANNSNPPSPPNFSYTPVTLIEAANNLIAKSIRVWDYVATIPCHEATFSTAIQPLIDDENARSAQGRILYFLSTVSPDKEIRAAGKEADIALKHDVIQRFARPDVFSVVRAVAQRSDVEKLPAEARVYLRKVIEEFVRGGLAIEDLEDRMRLKDINLRLTELQTQFSANLNGDDSGIWLTAQELDGVTPAVLERFKRDDTGRYFVTFKRPNINAVLGHVDNAGVRRKFYIAWDNRLKDSNGPLLLENLRLRREAALLLGFNNFAELMDEQRMLSAKRVKTFLDSIRQPLIDIAEIELRALSEIKAAHLNTLTTDQKDDSSTDAIFRWDTIYYKRLAKLQNSGVDVAKVAEYFSFQILLPRLLDVYSLLFGLRFVEMTAADDGIIVWHMDVQVWAVWNDAGEGGDFIGYLYVDPYPRDGKYGHVGTYGVQLGYLKPDGTRQYPAAALIANYPPPTKSQPSLLRFQDVVNLFHELGHSVHNLVGRCTYSRFHGSQVARDFTEIPAKFFEHLFWNPNMIRAMSCHYQKPELNVKLPEDLIRSTVETRFDDAASTKLSDLNFAIFDHVVHTTWIATEDNGTELSVLFNRLRRENSLLCSLEDLGQGYDKMHGQTHFRAVNNNYASAYYTYTSSDAFGTDLFDTKFGPLLTTEAHHDLQDIINEELRAEGRRFRHAILEPGSSTGSEAEMMKAYLGRDPDINAFVKTLAAAARLSVGLL